MHGGTHVERAHSAVLSIDVVDGDTAADRIEFRGVGHHPKATIPVPVTSRPVEPVPLPRQVAVLSPYVLDFSSVHPHSVTPLFARCAHARA